jgi:hypothetical protein
MHSNHKSLGSLLRVINVHQSNYRVNPQSRAFPPKENELRYRTRANRETSSPNIREKGRFISHGFFAGVLEEEATQIAFGVASKTMDLPDVSRSTRGSLLNPCLANVPSSWMAVLD